MKHRNDRLLFGALFLFLFTCFLVPKKTLNRYFSKMCNRATSLFFRQKSIPEKHHITVFVHGTFGTFMGFLSFSDVVKDKLKGTTYKKTVGKMRKDPNYFALQPILGRGLKKISPSYDPAQANNKKLAAYPIIKAYQTVSEKTTLTPVHNHFYTFGWSGLISQHRRRVEAIRFYNALSEEIERFNERGINPSVQILAHSHGGNVCLNLAAISHILNTNKIGDEQRFVKDDHTNESLQKVFSILKDLPHKENALSHKGQKRYDYLPTNKSLHIEKLVVLGMPVQPETQHFCASKMFGKIYHIYSDEDKVQDMDWVSTKNSFSRKRFDSKAEQANNKLVQVKIMYDRDLCQDRRITPTIQQSELEIESVPFWKKAFKKLFESKKSNDPGHKDLWFLTWKEEDTNTPKSPLFPLPTVILLPLVLNSIDSFDACDVDVNITTSSDQVSVDLLKHDEQEVERNTSISKDLLDQMKEKFKKWKPDDTSRKFRFDKLYQHLFKKRPA